MRKLFFLIFFLLSFDLSAQVNFQWIKKFNTGGTVNEARLITTDVSGNIYVCCYTNKYGTGLDIITLKYNTSGDSIWTRRYNDSLNLSETPKAIIVDSQNNVIIAGNTTTPSSGLDGLLIKYAPNGEILWKLTYNGLSNADDDFQAVAVDNLNSIYVTGSTKEPGYADLQCLTMKFNAQGNQIWASKYGYTPFASEYGFAICMDSTNQYCCVISQSNAGAVFEGLVTIKYGCVFGDSLWTRKQTAGNDWTRPRTGKIITDNNGNIYAATSNGITVQSRDFLLMKYAPNGDTLWMRTYGEISGQGDEIGDIKVDNSKNVYITGVSNFGNNSNWSTIKYDSAGVRKWVKIYDRSGYGDEPCGLYIDKSGNILVGGYGSTSYYDYILNKYNPNTGVLINSYIYNNNYHDMCYGMAKDTSDNVYLTGIFSTTSSIIDIATMKLSPTTGINQISTEIPSSFNLYQNYPNPFNPVTKIKFDIKKSVASSQESVVTLKVFDITGKEVATLVNEQLRPGTYEVTFDGSNFPSGVYFCKMIAGDFTETKKLLLIK